MKWAIVTTALVALLLLIAFVTMPLGTPPEIPDFQLDSDSQPVESGNLSVPTTQGDSVPEPTEPPAQGAFRCTETDFPPFSDMDEKPSDEQMMQEWAARADRLAASPDLEHQLTAALVRLGNEEPAALEELLGLRDSLPEHPILNARLLDACAVNTAHPFCESGDAEAQVLAKLGSNGVVWARVASYRAQRGDDAGALEALISASSASNYTSYWADEVALAFHSFAAAEGGWTDSTRLAGAVGVASGLPNAHWDVFRYCRKRAVDSVKWRQACLAFAVRTESDGSEILGRLIGAQYQKGLYELDGDIARAEASQRRAKQISPKASIRQSQDASVLMAADNRVVLAYLERLTSVGELAARAFLFEEVERVKRIPGYDPCPPNSK